jgi:hypothetical protein
LFWYNVSISSQRVRHRRRSFAVGSEVISGAAYWNSLCTAGYKGNACHEQARPMFMTSPIEAIGKQLPDDLKQFEPFENRC